MSLAGHRRNMHGRVAAARGRHCTKWILSLSHHWGRTGKPGGCSPGTLLPLIPAGHPMWSPTRCPPWTPWLWIWGESTLGGTQGLLLALCSQISPGRLRGLYGMLGSNLGGCMQGKSPPRCYCCDPWLWISRQRLRSNIPCVKLLMEAAVLCGVTDHT